MWQGNGVRAKVDLVSCLLGLLFVKLKVEGLGLGLRFKF